MIDLTHQCRYISFAFIYITLRTKRCKRNAVWQGVVPRLNAPVDLFAFIDIALMPFSPTPFAQMRIRFLQFILDTKPVRKPSIQSSSVLQRDSEWERLSK